MVPIAVISTAPSSSVTPDHAMPRVLVRYGLVPQVARYDVADDLVDEVVRGSTVVVATDRGLEIGDVLELLPLSLTGDHESSGQILRLASDEDRRRQNDQLAAARSIFDDWAQRIDDWSLQLELIDIEQTLDDEPQLILYVLNDQNAETTRLALLAAAGGHGIVTVQPVSADGIVHGAGGGGCGSGGCGCEH